MQNATRGELKEKVRYQHRQVQVRTPGLRNPMQGQEQDVTDVTGPLSTGLSGAPLPEATTLLHPADLAAGLHPRFSIAHPYQPPRRLLQKQYDRNARAT